MLAYYNDLQPDIWIYDTSDGYEAMEGVMDQEASDGSGSERWIREQWMERSGSKQTIGEQWNERLM